MVLADLGERLQSALRSLSSSTVVDETLFKAMLSDIQRALLHADVNVKQVRSLCDSVKAKAKLDEQGAGINKRVVVQKAVFDSLCEMLDPGKPAFKPVKGRSNVVMFVGLQGCGKTTSCTKLAYYYQRKGWKTCLVCADTYRAGAYDQLKQNATKANIPFFGSYTERDPVRVAQDGVDLFRSEKYEMIIVDTSGRHKQEAALFEEMEQVAAVVEPDDIIFTMDSSIGQAAFDQADAFRRSVDVGSVIITKLDGHAKGGGALSAVAATNSPIVFVGTGEHIQEFEKFDARSFVGRLLGRGDIAGLVALLGEQETEETKKTAEKIMQGHFSLRMLYDQFQTIMSMGPISQVMSMIPGLSQMMPKGKEQESVDRIRMCMTIMDSMNEQELDATDLKIFKDESRIFRIARGAGVFPRDVSNLFVFAKPFQQMISKAKGMNLGRAARGGNLNARQMASMLNPQMLQQMGGMTGLQQMMNSMSSQGLGRGGPLG